MILNFNKQIVFAENFLKTSSLDFGVFVIVFQEGLQDMTSETTGRGNQTLVVFLQQFPIHSWLVVIALKKSQAR